MTQQPGTPDPNQRPQYGAAPQYGGQPPQPQYGAAPQYGGQPSQPPTGSGKKTALTVLIVVVVMTIAFALLYVLFLRDDDAAAPADTTSVPVATTVLDATTVPAASVTPTTVAGAGPATTVAPAPGSTAPATTAPAAPATTAAPAPTAPAPVPPSGFLDPSLPANFGAVTLSPGFVPDPSESVVTSGGAVDASSVGGNCVGFASPAPDLKVQYSGGGGFLRIAFTPDVGGDTALVINDPNGNWICNDDFVGLDPAIEFSAPDAGRYDVWVASFDADDFVAGTISITEIP